jgi:hypothetical protein
MGTGFGLPKPGSDLPTPVLFAMTDMENKDSNAAELKRKFSFFSTDTVSMLCSSQSPSVSVVSTQNVAHGLTEACAPWILLILYGITREIEKMMLDLCNNL